ncbi:MAG: penicillin-binding protein [Bacteroidota bacterium]|nr:penicillin-binding protein [Bacteroidota bacterium]
MASFAAVILYYTYKIQFVEGGKWVAMQTEQTTELRTISAMRGNIYAADGSLMATSVPIYNVVLDPHASGLSEDIWKKNIDSLALMLANINPEKSRKDYLVVLNKARKGSDRYVPLLKKISYDQLKKVKHFPIFRLGRNKGGILIEEQDIRENPFGMLAIRTIGQKKENERGIGLEAAYNEELKGREGKRLMQKIVGGNWIPISDDNDVEPHNGYDIYTTIDMSIQDIAENSLKNALIKEKASYGCVVLMETNTGAIKAIANLKRNDNDEVIEADNYSISEATEPGSTFKLASVLALLEDGYANENETVSSEDGTTTYGDRTMRDSEHGGKGMLTLQKAFELSSNVGISKFVWKYYSNNPSRFVNRLVNDFKFGQSLKLGFPDERVYKVVTPQDRQWSSTTLPWMSIGYAIMVTPMQILTLYNAVANNGRMVKPMFVKRVEQTGKLIKEYNTEVLSEKIVSDKTLQRVMPMLTGVVEHGTATSIRSKIYPIGGKTGTAQIVEGGKYVEKYKSSFCGFFPADKPQYTCMVMIFKPSNGVYYGALVAGPVFKEIADKVYAASVNREPENIHDTNKINYITKTAGYTSDFYQVTQNKAKVYSTQEWSNATTNSTKINITETQVSPNNQMPDVMGMGLRDALYLLENRGLKVQYVGKKGKVKFQSLEKGTRIYKGNTVVIELI